MANEVVGFAKAIGAVRMVLQTSTDERRLFASRNYFQIPSGRLIIKISRIRRPFWGVGVRQIEVLEKQGVYYLILLISDKEGWFLSHAEIKKLRPDWSIGNPYDYKINPPLPDTNRFNSPEDFLRKVLRDS